MKQGPAVFNGECNKTNLLLGMFPLSLRAVSSAGAACSAGDIRDLKGSALGLLHCATLLSNETRLTQCIRKASSAVSPGCAGCIGKAGFETYEACGHNVYNISCLMKQGPAVFNGACNKTNLLLGMLPLSLPAVSSAGAACSAGDIGDLKGSALGLFNCATLLSNETTLTQCIRKASSAVSPGCAGCIGKAGFETYEACGHNVYNISCLMKQGPAVFNGACNKTNLLLGMLPLSLPAVSSAGAACSAGDIGDLKGSALGLFNCATLLSNE